MEKIELLAPAGSLEKLQMAIIYGADAVYAGGMEYSLRTAAENFTLRELKKGVDFARKYGKKVYAALNTMPHECEIKALKKYLSELGKTCVDAVIVSDPGVFSLVREVLPKMDIHISTQANTVNSESAKMWHALGAKRIILARENSFKEIKNIYKNIPKDLELEVFIHGAMCMAYSGRCLLSSYLTGRHSNRGDCAQPCRWKYFLTEEKRPGEYMEIAEGDKGTFIFNSKDLCMIEHIAGLVKSGVKSIKIEGRVKSIYYVATVVKAYREALDSYYKNPKKYKFNPLHLSELEKVSHREYSTGFFLGKPSAGGQIYGNSSYIRECDIVALVKSYNKNTKIATIEQRGKFYKGDKLEIIQPGVEGFISFKADYLTNLEGKDILSAPHAQQILKIKSEIPLKINSIIRKEKV